MKCIYCNQEKANITEEHVIPQGIGGNLNIANPFKLKSVCGECNSTSGRFIDGKKTLKEAPGPTFKPEIGFLKEEPLSISLVYIYFLLFVAYTISNLNDTYVGLIDLGSVQYLSHIENV